ncbi:MAG: efflux RND transporter periplasmic adaptor subunit [Phycisphaeraceae bacterium]|nr:efflux RND transporter periplasmic adaptor subunit [Phycisphaeraceae bacterium]MCB9848813.1 efflux RND transporter periplasmic adaptor subunit [Phycisphaeraceae bacterium]
MNNDHNAHDRDESKPVSPLNAGDGNTPLQSAGNQEPPPSPKPPRGPRVWILAIVIVAIGLGILIGAYWGSKDGGRSQQAMQPVSDGGENSMDDSGDSSTVEYYTCGMHPWVILPNPGLCPICHMDLTPLDPDKFTGEISIDPVVTQNIGVRVAPVVSGPVVRLIRTVGTVTYDETRVRDVNIKIPGWIEKLHVDYEGAEVKSGDSLFEFYSPKLYSAQSEYLTALRMQGKVGVDFIPDTALDAGRLIADARVQLEFYDITPEQIVALEAAGEPAKTMTIRSPHSGIVIAKHANEGMKLDPGMRVFQIADLSKVWIMVSLYEYQLPFVQVGQQATMSLPYIPGQTFKGRVIYVYPYLDEKTRQISVRLEFENPGLLLKPGMFASVDLQSTLARDRTIAPRSAVIDTGERQVAFVSLGEGRFEPRDVLMGVETGYGQVEILDGLKPGEMVVTSGQFLLDSESRIRESLAKMIKGDLASEQQAVVEVSGASELSSLPAAMSEGITAALGSYFAIGDLLASDTTDGVVTPSRALAGSVDELLRIEIPENPHFWHQHDEIATVRGKALELAEGPDIETARLAFADLSVALVKLVKATGVPPGYDAEVQELHCPMYREGQGGSAWLQPAGDVRNPFFGSVMLECFDERTALPVTGKRADDAPPSGIPAGDAPESNTDSNASVSPEAQGAIDALVRAYLTIQNRLTVDDLDGAGAQLHALHGALSQIGSASPPESVARLVSQMHGSANLDSSSLVSFRQDFRGLSDMMIELVRVAPPSTSVGPAVYHAYCPMEKAHWLQTSEVVANPYDPGMLRCGSIKEEFQASASKEDAR